MRMFETPESKLYPEDDGRCITTERENYAEQLLDDETEWETIDDAVVFDHELAADLTACIKELVEKRRHCLADSLSVQAAVNGLVHVYERAAMKIAKERIK